MVAALLGAPGLRRRAFGLRPRASGGVRPALASAASAAPLLGDTGRVISGGETSRGRGFLSGCARRPLARNGSLATIRSVGGGCPFILFRF